jgi:hypothetical protein
MRRADIEVPNPAVNMNYRARLACYPRGNFYPVSNDTSTSYQRTTMSCFRNCSTCQSHSKAPFCHYTQQLISIQLEGTFETLRYSLVRNLPSQTAHLTLSHPKIIGSSKKKSNQREVLHWRLQPIWRSGFKVSLLCSTLETLLQY